MAQTPLPPNKCSWSYPWSPPWSPSQKVPIKNHHLGCSLTQSNSLKPSTENQKRKNQIQRGIRHKCREEKKNVSFTKLIVTNNYHKSMYLGLVRYKRITLVKRFWNIWKELKLQKTIKNNIAQSDVEEIKGTLWKLDFWDIRLLPFYD